MTGVSSKGGIWTHTHAQGEGHVNMKQRSDDAFMTTSAGQHPTGSLQRGRDQSLDHGLRGNQPCSHPDLGLVASRTERQSLLLSKPPVCSPLSWQHQQTNSLHTKHTPLSGKPKGRLILTAPSPRQVSHWRRARRWEGGWAVAPTCQSIFPTCPEKQASAFLLRPHQGALISCSLPPRRASPGLTCLLLLVLLNTHEMQNGTVT